MIAIEEQLLLFELPPDLPAGWRRVNQNKAEDHLGILWVWEGEWILPVPWFRSTPGNRSGSDDIAVIYRCGRHAEAPISPAGWITLPDGRRVGPRQWDH